MPFYKGQYRRSIDDANRIALPKAMREVRETNRYVLTRGLQTCLFLYPAARWADMEDEISELNVYDETVRDFCRTIMMWAFEAMTEVRRPARRDNWRFRRR